MSNNTDIHTATKQTERESIAPIVEWAGSHMLCSVKFGRRKSEQLFGPLAPVLLLGYLDTYDQWELKYTMTDKSIRGYIISEEGTQSFSITTSR